MNDRASVEVQELFQRHYLPLVRLAMRLLDDQPSAEDVVQEVFMRLMRAPVDLDDPPVYLRRAVVNGCRSALRRRRVARAFLRRSSSGPDAVAADVDTLHREDRDRMLTAIRRLPRRQREVIVLRYYEDLPVAAIATILAISAGAVSSALNRALSALATVSEVRRDR